MRGCDDYFVKASTGTSNITNLKYKPGETFFSYIEGLQGPRPEIVSYKLKCWPDTVDPRGAQGRRMMSRPPMDDYTRSFLEQFVKLANLSSGVGSLHALDWARFHEFVIHVHMRRLPTGEQDVINALFGYGVPNETANKLGGWFYEARRLLQLYDERRVC